MAAAAVLTAFLAAGCSSVTSSGARETLPPLPPPVQGAIVTQAPLPPASTTATTAAPTDTAADDDSDPTSVAARYLRAVATNNSAEAGALQTGGTDPDTFAWAQNAYESTVSVAGEQAWGAPSCSVAEGATTATCTWMQNDPGTALVLVSDGAAWQVSHPLSMPASGRPAAIGQACIVGDQSVNFRGGPGTGWPRFTQLPPGTCLSALDATVADAEGVWRMVDADGQAGWLVERVLRFQ